MPNRTNAPEIFVSHFKTHGDLIALLNSKTPLAKRVRRFIDNLRRVPGKQQKPIFAGSTQDLSLSAALRALNAELDKPWKVFLNIEWSHREGRRWSFSPNLGSEYQTWTWAVLDYDRFGDIDRICDCIQCGTIFLKHPRGGRKYCSEKCSRKARRSPEKYREKLRVANMLLMRKRRIEDALANATHGKWDRLKSADYFYVRSETCQGCGAKIELWRSPLRRKALGRRPRRVDIPLQKIRSSTGERVRTHWPHRDRRRNKC
jgi:hypothetical protein